MAEENRGGGDVLQAPADRIEQQIDMLPEGVAFSADEEELLVSAIKMVRVSMVQRLSGIQHDYRGATQ